MLHWKGMAVCCEQKAANLLELERSYSYVCIVPYCLHVFHCCKRGGNCTCLAVPCKSQGWWTFQRINLFALFFASGVGFWHYGRLEDHENPLAHFEVERVNTDRIVPHRRDNHEHFVGYLLAFEF